MSEAMDDIVRRHNKLMEDMKRAIAQGVLSKKDKARIEEKTQELRTFITRKGNHTTEEEQILHKIETTYNLIMKIESEYLNQHINIMRKI